jgi:membrane associated rhomboid family serine protease
MFLPIGDDNRDRTTTPYVNYLFIILNIIVFVFLQGMGRNDAFTFAYSTVPAEILSGQDIVTKAKVIIHPITGDRFLQPPLEITPIPVY